MDISAIIEPNEGRVSKVMSIPEAHPGIQFWLALENNWTGGKYDTEKYDGKYYRVWTAGDASTLITADCD
jgi:hypothetical protein